MQSFWQTLDFQIFMLICIFISLLKNMSHWWTVMCCQEKQNTSKWSNNLLPCFSCSDNIRQFKIWANSAALRNLMGYLFAKNRFRQSLRLDLAGSWNSLYSQLMRYFHILKSQCPTLANCFVSSHEHFSCEFEDYDLRSYVIDAHHQQIHLWTRPTTFTGLLPSIEVSWQSLHCYHASYPFTCHLCAAYETHYQIRNLVNVEGKLVRRDYVAFSDL